MPIFNPVPLADVQTLLTYDKETGTLHLTNPDTPRDVCRPHTASQWRIRGKHFGTHRIVWAMHNPDNPNPRYVEHLNGDLEDHRIENLAVGLYMGIGGARPRATKRPAVASDGTPIEKPNKRLPCGITINPYDGTYDVAYTLRDRLFIVGTGYPTLDEAAVALRIHRQMRAAGHIPDADLPATRRSKQARADEAAAMRVLQGNTSIETLEPVGPEDTSDNDTEAPAYTKLPAAKMTPAQRRAKMRDLLNGTFDPNKDYTAPDPSEPDPDEKIASIIKSLPKTPAHPTAPTTAPASDASSPDDDDDWTSIFDAHGFKPAG